jgi:hypothetical protein
MKISMINIYSKNVNIKFWINIYRLIQVILTKIKLNHRLIKYHQKSSLHWWLMTHPPRSTYRTEPHHSLLSYFSSLLSSSSFFHVLHVAQTQRDRETERWHGESEIEREMRSREWEMKQRERIEWNWERKIRE